MLLRIIKLGDKNESYVTHSFFDTPIKQSEGKEGVILFLWVTFK